jgi:thioredoxin-dependent peroxiredoxin
MYGRKYMGTARVTFVVDANGVIENVVQKVDTRNHAAQILGAPITSSATSVKTQSRKPAAKPAKKATRKVKKRK